MKLFYYKNFLKLIVLKDTKGSFTSKFHQSCPSTPVPSELNIKLFNDPPHLSCPPARGQHREHEATGYELHEHRLQPFALQKIGKSKRLIGKMRRLMAANVSKLARPLTSRRSLGVRRAGGLSWASERREGLLPASPGAHLGLRRCGSGALVFSS